MRTILKSTDEVMHYWANQVQSEGRAGNVFFRDSKLFSYGEHFCIARILPGMEQWPSGNIRTVAFTTRSYSNTTSRHVSQARSAARHMNIVCCNDPLDDARGNMRAARDAVVRELADAEKPRIRHTTRVMHRTRALELAQRANTYLMALPANELQGEVQIDTSNLQGVVDEAVAIEMARYTLGIEREAARMADLVVRLGEWRTGAIIASSGLYSLPVALRLNAACDLVQTSHGADIPVTHAVRIWDLVRQCRADGRDYAMPAFVKAGVYQLSLVRADGSIVVGCHDIAYSELVNIAAQLGLTSAQVAWDAEGNLA